MSELRSLNLSEPQHEGLRYATVGSPALGRRADMTLWAPQNPEGLPLVVLLHGIFGSHWDWSVLGGAHRIAASLIESRRIRPVILAMPSDGLWGQGSAYIRRGGEDAERWITEDVPAAARMAYPEAGDGGRLIAGLSMGGFGALRLAALHSNRYVAAAGTSSVTRIEHLRRLTDGVGYDVPEGEDRLIDVITRAKKNMPPFRFDCGLSDSMLEANRRLHGQLDEAGIPHEYAEFEGGHDWQYWPQRLVGILEFFEQVLSRAR